MGIKETLLTYCEYNFWANSILLSYIKEESFDTEITASFPSIRKTLFHTWDAEHIWHKRLNGESLQYWPSENFTGTLDEAKELIKKQSQAFIDYVSKCDDARLSESLRYKNTEGIEFTAHIYDMIHHCMNHSTYHRGQIVNMLRQTGVTGIRSTDFIVYLRELGK